MERDTKLPYYLKVFGVWVHMTGVGVKEGSLHRVSGFPILPFATQEPLHSKSSVTHVPYKCVLQGMLWFP